MPNKAELQRWWVPVLFLGCGWIPIAVASDPMFLLRGSDAGGCCLQPALWTQLLAWAGTAGALLWRGLGSSGTAGVMGLVIAACGYVLSLHGLCYSVDRELVFEHWAGLRIRALPLDPSDGELTLVAGWLFLRVDADGQPLEVFRGVTPWRIPQPGPLACGN